MFNFFLPFDTIILSAEHILAMILGFILTPLMKGISTIGYNGLIMLAIGLGLCLNKKTRKYGIACIGAVFCAFIINTLIIKNIFMRMRPYEYNDLFKGYWEFVKSTEPNGYSFPSGHVSGIVAGYFAIIFLMDEEKKKKHICIAIICILVMSFSRTYLMHHYPSDCLFGALTGILSAFISCIITKCIYAYCEKNTDKKFCNFILNWSLFGSEQ